MLHGTISSLYQVKYKMGYVTLTQVCGKFIMLGYVLFTVLYLTPVRGLAIEKGFFQLLVAGVIGNGIMFFWIRQASKQFVNWKLQWDFEFWQKFLREAIPYGIALILNTIYFRIDSILLTLIHNDGLVQVGYYGVAMRILEAISVIPIYFMNSVLPVLSVSVGESKKRFFELLDGSFLFLIALVSPLFVGGWIFARRALLLWAFAQSYHVVFLLFQDHLKMPLRIAKYSQ
jgi:O-antigen/teichoic acid export membrane protein